MVLEIANVPTHTILIPGSGMTDEEFVRFCEENAAWRIERDPKGVIIVMTPSLEDSGARNNTVSGQLYAWAKRDRSGKAMDSSTGYHLPNGATRCPDASWISMDRLKQARENRVSGFLPACPEFVVEVRSHTDSLRDLQAKMHEYMECGAQLGWLIDPYSRKLFVYRPNHRTKILESPTSIHGDPVLAGFTLDLSDIWDVGF